MEGEGAKLNEGQKRKPGNNKKKGKKAATHASAYNRAHIDPFRGEFSKQKACAKKFSGTHGTTGPGSVEFPFSHVIELMGRVFKFKGTRS